MKERKGGMGVVVGGMCRGGVMDAVGVGGGGSWVGGRGGG